MVPRRARTPDLPEDRTAAAVRRHYGLRLTSLAFLPQGLDVLARAYRAASADGALCFLKLRRGVVNQAALSIPRYLADHGVPHVVAPIPTRAGQLWGEVEGFTLTLYPFITGNTGMAQGLQEYHWVTYGAALRALHDTPLAEDLARDLPREFFTSRLTAVAQAPEAHIAGRAFTDPGERDLAAIWQVKRAEITALVARFERLGRLLRARRPPLVLCHADVHPNNVLIDARG
jgi:spectinomycin phosphotransferase